jgi:acyl-lipid omega-6 desaturase (Delta-12 desaturase)
MTPEPTEADNGPGPSDGPDRPFWRDAIAPYERAKTSSALLDLATSVVPYLALSVAGYLALTVSVWIALGLSVLASGFLLRTFIVFHDCAHGSFFASKRANLWVGRLTAFLVYQAYAKWRHDHAVHHGTAGDLDRRGTGDVLTLTVDEYLSRSWRGRLAYRLFRSPLVMFGIGPLWSLMFAPRIWSAQMRPRQLHSVWMTNIALAVVLVPIWVFVGFGAWAAVQLPAALIAGTAGVWLFYVQHQFEDAYWEQGERWSYADAALQGSSYLKLRQPFQFFTGNIGLHHVHHLSAKVPNYNLQRAHDELEIFHDVPVLTAWYGLKATRLKLIDAEGGGRLITWGDLRARRSASPAGSVAGL